MLILSFNNQMQDVNDQFPDRPIEAIDVPDRWLRIFHLAARERSFTRAARSLGVGQPSVSHAIRQLEKRIEAPLFDRTATPIELTPIGAGLYDDLGPAFDMVDRAVRRVRHRNRALTISVSTSFATWWLLPRLTSFKAEHPDIDLRCITSDNDDRVGHDEADLWIPHGPGPWPGFEQQRLTAERVHAVASPVLAGRMTDPSAPDSVHEAPIIHLEETYRPRFDWRAWCQRKGVEVPVESSMTSNDYAIVVQAALDGQGVALGWHHIVSPLLEAGRLVAIGGNPIETDEPFVTLRRPGHRSEALDRLEGWLIATAA